MQHNLIGSKHGEHGIRTLLSEVREAMQTEEKKQRKLGKSHGR